jgi:uncharacterized protein (DUF983 family)
MFKRGSFIYSILKFKCPRCHEGDFYISHPYDLKRVGDFHHHCSECGFKYEKEPGFYYGAMYVAYALAVALFVTFWVSFNLFFTNVPIGWQIASIILATIVLAPYIYALSKPIWAKLFITYDKDAIQRYKESTHS